MKKTYKLESRNTRYSGAFTIILTLFIIIIVFIIIFALLKWGNGSKYPSWCKKHGCNCCNMPREPNVNSSQPEGWNCVDCPDGDITKNASRGWITLDVKGIESKIKKYNINIEAHKNFKCLFDSMKKKKYNDCMSTLWPTVKNIPKYLCWRSWKYNDQEPNIFEYTPCEYQSNFNILLPNSNSIAVDEFSKWWNADVNKY